MKHLKLTYLIIIHIVLALVLWKSNALNKVSGLLSGSPAPPESSDYHQWLTRFHSRSVDAVPDDSVIFIGDSLTQGLAVSAVHPLSVNYGIGGDTTTGVIDRLPIYSPALKRAKCIVIAIGVNDYHDRSVEEAIQHYARILDMLPPDRKVVVSAILPLDDSRRSALTARKEWSANFNSKLKDLTSNHKMVTFTDSSKILDIDQDGRLDSSLHDGDGLHLNSEGNIAWASVLRAAILAD